MLKREQDSAGISDVNNIQALLLHKIGDSELTAGELRSGGHYQGSNVSYNLKKLVEAGYVHHERSETDRRSVRVRLTPAGNKVRRLVADMYARHSNHLIMAGPLGESFKDLTRSLREFESFWQSQLKSQA
ncbi:MAG: MarR family transcriptional regulator [Alphaproteobacteria bacterium]|nr:MarR family transcriptional regulator [Alphaproteobacteria bacterium]